MNNIINHIETLSQDAAFMAEIRSCETAEAICDTFARQGIDLDPAQLDAVIDAADNTTCELNADELDNVNGGFISGAAFLAYSVVYSLVICQSSYVLGRANSKKK